MLKVLAAELKYHRDWVVLIFLAHVFNLFIIVVTEFSVDFLAIWFIFPFVISGHILGRQYRSARISLFLLLPLSLLKIAAIRLTFVLLIHYCAWLLLLLLAAPFLHFGSEMLFGLLSLYAAITALVFLQIIGSDLTAFKSSGGQNSRRIIALILVAFFLSFAFVALFEPSGFQYNHIVSFLKSATGLATFSFLCAAASAISLLVFVRRPSFLK